MDFLKEIIQILDFQMRINVWQPLCKEIQPFVGEPSDLLSADVAEKGYHVWVNNIER